MCSHSPSLFPLLKLPSSFRLSLLCIPQRVRCDSRPPVPGHCHPDSVREEGLPFRRAPPLPPPRRGRPWSGPGSGAWAAEASRAAGRSGPCCSSAGGGPGRSTASRRCPPGREQSLAGAHPATTPGQTPNPVDRPGKIRHVTQRMSENRSSARVAGTGGHREQGRTVVGRQLRACAWRAAQGMQRPEQHRRSACAGTQTDSPPPPLSRHPSWAKTTLTKEAVPTPWWTPATTQGAADRVVSTLRGFSVRVGLGEGTSKQQAWAWPTYPDLNIKMAFKTLLPAIFAKLLLLKLH